MSKIEIIFAAHLIINVLFTVKSKDILPIVFKLLAELI